jgi:hypothetical protein
MDRDIPPKGVVVPRVNNYAINSQFWPNCQQSLSGIVFISGIEFMNSFELFGTNIRQGEIGQQIKRTQRTFNDDIDAIAYGVETWFGENTGYFENVAETTVEIARKLGVPEDEIRRWAARRSTFNVERVRSIKSLLQRKRSSSPADGLRAGSINRNKTR